jgi:rhamnosyltransferase
VSAKGGSGTTAGTVCGVLVTYNPDLDLLDQVVEAATQQVDELLILDNGSDATTVSSVHTIAQKHGAPLPGRSRVNVRALGENRGLPAAFNEAIEFAQAQHHAFLLFLDHDSILAPGAVAALRQGYASLASRVKVGAVEAYNDEPAVLPTDDFLEGYLRRHHPPLDGGITKEFLATNSGLFLPLEVVGRVGKFDESFFVDAVDFEFGLRLHALGWPVFRVPAARIIHRRGEPTESHLVGARWRLRQVAPQRHYYVGRDTLRLSGRYVRRFPLVGLFLLTMPFREAGLVVLFYPNKGTHLRALCLGILHAVSGVRGQFEFT